MTQLLEQVYERLSGLPATEQDAIAALILEELEDEAKWQQAFDHSADALARLAAEALAEHRAGRTRPLDPETL